jgi:glycosyltransferase involved in cell wall biosynthesis
MKVLVVSGWYPDRAFPINALWVRDQAIAVSDKVTAGVLAPRSPLEWLRGRGKPDPLTPREGLYELRPQLPLWGIKRWRCSAMISCCIARAAEVEQHFGVPDIIHAHMANPGGGAALRLKQRWGSRVIITEHTGPFEQVAVPDTPFGDRVFSALEAADAVVAVSPFQRERMQACGIRREIEVIGNIVHEIPRRQELPASGPGGRGITLLNVGFPSRLKGTHTLIESMGLLVREGLKHIRLRIVGGDEDDEWRRLIEEHGVRDHVAFAGLVPREKLHAEYAACDAVIHASTYESFCVGAAEALSAGKSVIITPCGGPQWFVDDSNGVIAADFSAGALAAAVREWLQRREQYEPERIAAALQSRFSPGAIARQLVALYETVLGGRNVPSLAPQAAAMA